MDREWRRFALEPHRRLRGELRARFLRKHLSGVRGRVLELGPGPGRFSPEVLRSRGASLLAVDLSREGLLHDRKVVRRAGGERRSNWVQGAGEHLPLQDRSVVATVLLGNLVCMAARDGEKFLREVARVTRPGGDLIVDFCPAVGAVQDFLFTISQNRRLPRVLRDPEFYLVDQVLRTGFQPFAPERWSRWEFSFYTAREARAMLARVGFRVGDSMAVAPLAAFQPDVARIALRDPRTWRNLLELEERAGREPEVHSTGQGFVMAARRR
ncbi:MAG: class I SAM-dependent methyltransferase [Euryarchaeota archaeon]|nr:class I SAM-dependent methyltransferase [Euryarchaeota archaeon]